MTEPSLAEGALESLVARVADEFAERRRRGERPSPEEYATLHPEAAGLLRRVLAALDLVDASLAASGTVGGHEDGASGTLGDYRIVREVGRGGMGFVYEAEQISLGRRVALKVLPFAATMDPRQLQRFHNEARAAASLHHEHIVPVHGVGCERGVHFYAMQFIDGVSLAELIARQRQPAGAPTSGDPTTPYAATMPVAAATTLSEKRDAARYRRIAQWGIEAAEALEHAHRVGIVHRDVKPGNLIVDAQGKLWVADFGLARTGEDNGLTMSGDLLGTLRYMSPEQAMARHGLVDHRADVYGLGATLYELLTLRPAVDGKDRAEVLRNIAFEEPAGPWQINPGIPVDLETVVLKALAKDPRERYATAKDLADDLRRWAEDRPVTARRPSLAQRLSRFVRRHRSVVVTAALGLLLAVAVLAGSVGWVVSDLRSRRQETGRAVAAALDEAKGWLRKDRPYEALSAALRAEGMLRQAGGHPEYQRPVDEMLWDVRLVLRLEQARLSYEQHLLPKGWDDENEKAFKEFGLDLMGMPVAEAAERLRRREVRVEIAAHLDYWAVVRPTDNVSQRLFNLAQLIDPDETRGRIRGVIARQDYNELKRLAETVGLERLNSSLLGAVLRAQDANGRKNVEALARRALLRSPADFWLNWTLANLLDPQNVVFDGKDAIGFYRAAIAARPQSAHTYVRLGTALLRTRDVDEATACYLRAIDLQPDFDLAHNMLGQSLSNAPVEDAIAIFRRIISEKPDSAGAFNELGKVLLKKGDVAEATKAFTAANRLKPDRHQYLTGLGNALLDQGKLGEAVACYQEAIRLSPHSALAAGSILSRKGKYNEAVACFREAIRLRPTGQYHEYLGYALLKLDKADEAAASFQEAVRIHPDQFSYHEGLGNALLAQGKVDEAVAYFQEYVRLKPKSWRYRLKLGDALLAQGKVDEALASFQEAVRIEPKDNRPHNAVGRALSRKGKVDEAIACYQKAIRIYRWDSTAHWNLGIALRSQGRFDVALRHLSYAHQLVAFIRPQDAKFSVQVRECRRLLELERQLPTIVAGKQRPASPRETLEYAQCAAYKGHHVTAIGLYREAFNALPELARPPKDHCYNAACYAALAGCGKSEDAGQLGRAERAAWRLQALTWLRAYLRQLSRQAGEGPPASHKARNSAVHSLNDPDFANVRGDKALAALPPDEAMAWRTFWADVATLVPPKRASAR